MKLVGAVFILGACLSAVIGWNDARSTRIREMDRFLAALRQLDLELSGRGEALPALIKRLGERSEGMAADFFTSLFSKLDSLGDQPFANLWEQTISEQTSVLKENELALLLPLGNVLGRLTITEQHLEIAHCVQRLTELCEKERRCFDRDRRLVWPLSASAALLLLILLV